MDSISNTLNVLFYNTQCRIRDESARNYLGFFWWILDPAINLAVYYVFVGVLLGRGGPLYVYSLMVGLLTWRWVSNAIKTSVNSIIVKRALINQVYIQKFIFPLTEVLYSTWKYLIIFSVLTLIYLLLGFGNLYYLTYLPFILFIFLLLATGGSFIAASITPFVPDIQFIVPQVLMILFYGSGVIFDKAFVPEKFHAILELNPLFNCFEALKNVMIYNTEPNIGKLLLVFVIAILLNAVGLWILVVNDRRYPKVI